MKPSSWSQQQLQTCYDQQAKHFHHTRSFYRRPELSHIRSLLTSYTQQHLSSSTETQRHRLLDLGCGTGRIYGRLQHEQLDTNRNYTGVDISNGMIQQAKQHYPSADMYHTDMISHLQQTPPQTYDAILCLASFHHLPTRRDRLYLLQQIYQALTYGGLCIMVNRSFSHRFLSKYRKHLMRSVGSSLITLGATSRNDLYIPWKDPNYQTNKIIHHRYYHLFTLRELYHLITPTDLTVQHGSYIRPDGTFTQHWKKSRNSFILLKKQR